ncbi:MAG TPA: hypothetical protein VLT17_13800 [Gemmatimonadales bacterium]|nr:hypothetical protein [Gemmatimonadales bacterium]
MTFGTGRPCLRHLVGFPALLVLALGWPGTHLEGQEAPRLPEPAFEDNSFFVEEAYNQATRVVQHINGLWLAGERLENLFYTFTQEWPLGGPRHQLSYTIPLTRLAGQSLSIGDVQLNYRYQLLEGERWSIAPRLTLILPSGSVAKSLGFGTVGGQFNLPVSFRFSRQFVTHWNAGLTFLPRASASNGDIHRGLVNYNLGASVVGPLMWPVQFLLEGVVNFASVIDSTGDVRHGTAGVVSPGIRVAINVGKLQIVPGLGVPVLIAEGTSRVGLFSYLSFEHPF